MSQWSSLLSKVASISLKMAESTFIFMTSATCHLEIVFGRLGVVLLICCFVFKVCKNIQSLFPKNHAILILDITVPLVYTWCVLPSSLFPFFKKPNISIQCLKEICTWSSNQQFEFALGTYHWNELLHGGHAMTKSCLASKRQQALSSWDHSWPFLGKGP